MKLRVLVYFDVIRKYLFFLKSCFFSAVHALLPHLDDGTSFIHTRTRARMLVLYKQTSILRKVLEAYPQHSVWAVQALRNGAGARGSAAALLSMGGSSSSSRASRARAVTAAVTRPSAVAVLEQAEVLFRCFTELCDLPLEKGCRGLQAPAVTCLKPLLRRLPLQLMVPLQAQLQVYR